jgi:GTP-binding protein
VVGSCNRAEDIEINICRKKQMTNMRAAGKDDNVILAPAWVPTLEQALDYIDDDELLEVTPKSLRIRKRILDTTDRFRSSKK